MLGLFAIYCKPDLSKPHPEHKKYPYLLRNVNVVRVNQVWSTDITYIRLKHGFVYLTAVIDWYSRYVLAWRLSTTLEPSFCTDALEEALAKHGKPEIFNTDQGSQFTCDDFIAILKKNNITISMDGRGRALDNVFVERLWRTVKYENIYLKDYESITECHEGLKEFFNRYNNHREHQSLGYQFPAQIYFGKASDKKIAA
jgi:putative transposase